MEKNSLVWSHPCEGQVQCGSGGFCATATGEGLACQDPFLKPVHLWTVAKLDHSLVLLFLPPACVSQSVWSHCASVDTGLA